MINSQRKKLNKIKIKTTNSNKNHKSEENPDKDESSILQENTN